MSEFKLPWLTVFTVVILVLGLGSLTGDDLTALFLISIGFIYSSALYFSLKATLDIKKYVMGLLILGVSNLFVFYSSAVLMLVPTELMNYLIFTPPSILGAAITLLVLWKVWSVKITPNFSKLIFVTVAVISVISPLIVGKLEQSIRTVGFTAPVINSLLWCIAFTFCIGIYQYSANKALKTD